MEVLFPFSLRDPPGDVSRKPIKKPQPEMRVCGASSERRRCLSARHWTSGAAFQAAPIALFLYKRRANSLARKKPFEINRKKLIAASAGSGACCRSAHRQQNPAELLCSAKN